MDASPIDDADSIQAERYRLQSRRIELRAELHRLVARRKLLRAERVERSVEMQAVEDALDVLRTLSDRGRSFEYSSLVSTAKEEGVDVAVVLDALPSNAVDVPQWVDDCESGGR